MVLTSEETESSNQLIFKEIPPRCASGTTIRFHLHPGSRPCVPLTGESARVGRWIGVVPNLVPIHFAAPFTSPQFIHYRLNEFVDKSMSGLLGYITPRLPYGFFNLEAAAEYSWNAKGRTPREFAVSYAVRQGFRDPEKYADWVEAIGTVAWHVYGSDWPFGEQRNVPGKVAGRLKKGTLPELGYVLWDAYRSPFGDIKSEEQLERDVEMAARAVRLAREMGLREQWLESLIVQGYIDSLKASGKKGLVRDGRVAERDREQAERYFRMYVRGCPPPWMSCRCGRRLFRSRTASAASARPPCGDRPGRNRRNDRRRRFRRNQNIAPGREDRALTQHSRSGLRTRGEQVVAHGALHLLQKLGALARSPVFVVAAPDSV